MLDLTWRCNQKCAFCYNPTEYNEHSDPSGETLREIIGALAAWGVREILYLGGEPMLHPDFDSLLELGAALGLKQRVVTNGSRLGEHRAQLLAEFSAEVGISLHSAKQDIHDRLTGSRGSFSRAMRSLDALALAGVDVFVQYSPTRLDVEGLDPLATMLSHRHGGLVRFIDVNRLLPYGEGSREGRKLVLDEDGWWNVLQTMGRLASEGLEMRVESVPHCWVLKCANSSGLGQAVVDALLSCIRPCYMGISQLAFDPEGHFKLCPGGPPIGPSILEVNPNTMWREHPLLAERRALSFLSEKCVNYETGHLCKRFYECGGGCRSAAGIIPAAADPLVLKSNCLEA
jgi:MoaA/NifB/PqqE/SkfB family radical SAM enzyme